MLLLKNQGDVKYACLMLMCPPNLTSIINSWARMYLPDNVLDPTEGIENESHITIKYGIISDSYPDIIPALRGVRSVTAQLGTISMFENPDKPDVLKLEIISPDLIDLNKRVCETVECVDTYPGYTPHLTLAYLNKGMGHKFIGSKTFEKFSFTSDRLIFSDSKKNHVQILLQA